MKKFLFLLLFIHFIGAEEITYLKQKDFDLGTYLITKPGYYKLAENISFNPNSPKNLKTDAYDAGFLTKDQYKSNGGLYDDKGYALGFFAAIVITGNGVTLDLNNHTIEQSKEHALLQRFFAVIELSSQPFLPGEGPHDFGGHLVAGKEILIKNGKIGRSSHHGIHGNGNRNVRIENIRFEDFEIAAVSLNGVRGLVIENCTAKSRKDVPVLGIFSSARFLKPYLDYLVERGSKTTLTIGNQIPLTAKQVRDRLRHGIDAVYEDLILKKLDSIDSTRHPEEYALFHNHDGVVDGNCFGFLINFFGEAVDGFAVYNKVKQNLFSKDIKFKNIVIEGLEGKVIEIIALSNHGIAMTDPVGAVFQIANCYPGSKNPITVTSINHGEATYCGNMVANAQALVAKATLAGEFKDSGLETVHMNITQNVIDWIAADPSSPQAKLAHLVPTRKDFICNSDTMFHVNKGVIGFKIDAAENVIMENIIANNINNISSVGSGICGKYKFSHPFATLEGCSGPQTRAYCFAGSKNIKVKNCQANNLISKSASAVGFDILTDSSNIEIDSCTVDGANAGKSFYEDGGPNEDPLAIGFQISKDARNIVLKNICAKNLVGLTGRKIVFDRSGKAKVTLMKGCKEIK